MAGVLHACFGPWHAFLLACLGRAVVLLWLMFGAESFLLGLAPKLLRYFTFAGVVVFVLVSALQQIVHVYSTGATPDMAVTAETGAFRADSTTWCVCSMRGWREDMEDAHVVEMFDSSVFLDAGLFAVLDGHGGKEVSNLASKLLTKEVLECGREMRDSRTVECAAGGSALLQEALTESLPRLDAKLRAGPRWIGRVLPTSMHPFASCGSTACAAAVDFTSGEVIVANVGDSRALLIRSGKAIALSKDHKPEDPLERTRIRAAGGQVVKCGPCHRVDGNLNLSRALGDFMMKANSALPPAEQKVIAFPDSTRTPFIGGEQEVLVVACDGIFERCDNQDVADIIWPRLCSGMALEQIGTELLHACCARPSCYGQPRGPGTDNETVILVRLPASARTASKALGKEELASSDVCAGSKDTLAIAADAGPSV